MKTIPCRLAILICLFSPAAYSQSKGNNPFQNFVKALPRVDKIEIIDVTPLVTDDVERTDCSRPGLVCAPDSFPYVMGTVKTLIGEDAYRVSNQWRKLKRDYLHNDDKCLVPDHLVRFFKDDKVLLESQVCTLCRKITLPGMGVVSVAGSNEAPYYHFQNSLIPDSSWNQSRENFKREMLPKVGQQFTVNGLLLKRKAGMAVGYRDEEIYLFGVSLSRTNELINLGCHTAIKVTGILRHHGEPSPQAGSRIHAVLREHFYFERASVEVLRFESPSRQKRKKSR